MPTDSYAAFLMACGVVEIGVAVMNAYEVYNGFEIK